MNPKLLLLAPTTVILATSIFATPIFATTVFTDGTFANGVYQVVDLQTSPGSTLSITQGTFTGNPGDFVNAQFSFSSTPTGQTQSLNQASFRPDFLWTPSIDGPLGTMNFSMDVRNLGSSGYAQAVSAFWRPVILQSGLTFSVIGSALQATPNGAAFQTLNWNFTSASSWFNFPNPALAPDFSASGALILFGFRVEIGLNCSGGSPGTSCPTASVNDAMDNYRAELTAAQPSGIPEPSTWALGLAGLAALALRQRNPPSSSF